MKRIWLGVLVTMAACSEVPVAPPSDPVAPPDQAAAALSASDDPIVSTPNGPRYRSCVHEVPERSHVDQDGNVTQRDGRKFKIAKCARSLPPGQARTQAAANGWVESVRLPISSSFHQVTANWAVPRTPVGAYNSSQTFFTFPGMQNGSYVIQPVLQYGLSSAGGGSYWTIASWRCASGPDCYHSPLVGNVRSGDTMYGSVSASNCYSAQCDWTITTTDVTTGATTTYTQRDADNYKDGVGGAMEIWNLSSCNQLPAPGVSYTNVSFLDNTGSPVTPGWYSSYDNTVTPQCGYQATGSGTNVTLADNQVVPFTVGITGPQYIALHQSAQYVATVSGGTPPYNYQWRSRDGYYNSMGSWSPWFSTGSTNYTYASINSCGLNQKDLQVLVTDALGATVTGPYYIYITNPC